MRGLSNREQAVLMLLVFTLPSLTIWCGQGFPTGRTELGLLTASILSGTLAFVKELLGGQPPKEGG